MMKNRKDMVIVALATFCLTATLFMIISTRSQTANQYDPWVDLDDDGKISILDAIDLSNVYGTSGTPINKTALLLDLEDRVDALNSSLLNLQAYFNMRITTLEVTVGEQQVRITDLETELAVLNATKLGQPDYDSTWYNISKGESIILTHNLGTTDVIIYMIGNDTDSAHYIHQIGFGGDNYFSGAGGAYWYELTPTTIKTTRAANDNDWDQMRVLIWKIPT
jgi:hypothetical protein